MLFIRTLVRPLRRRVHDGIKTLDVPLRGELEVRRIDFFLNAVKRLETNAPAGALEVEGLSEARDRLERALPRKRPLRQAELRFERNEHQGTAHQRHGLRMLCVNRFGTE